MNGIKMYDVKGTLNKQKEIKKKKEKSRILTKALNGLGTMKQGQLEELCGTFNKYMDVCLMVPRA